MPAKVQDVSVWFGAIVRAANEPMQIGACSNIQDAAVLHSDPGSPLHTGENLSRYRHGVPCRRDDVAHFPPPLQVARRAFCWSQHATTARTRSAPQGHDADAHCGPLAAGLAPKKKPATMTVAGFFIGAAGRIRTHDPLVRSQVLYPTELQPLNRSLPRGR